jgi:hypothetical protein
MITRRWAKRGARPSAPSATQVKPGAHAVLLLDQAGWHLSGHLVVPPNISLVSLPPKCPSSIPSWQFLRDNWLSNRIFKSHEDILDHCCYAWNQLIDRPWKIMFVDTRDWAPRLELVLSVDFWRKVRP